MKTLNYIYLIMLITTSCKQSLNSEVKRQAVQPSQTQSINFEKDKACESEDCTDAFSHIKLLERLVLADIDEFYKRIESYNTEPTYEEASSWTRMFGNFKEKTCSSFINIQSSIKTRYEKMLIL